MHFTLVDKIFAYFTFSGLGKLVLSALSYQQNNDAAVRREQYLRPPGSDAAADGV